MRLAVGFVLLVLLVGCGEKEGREPPPQITIQMLDKPDKIVRGMMFDQDELYYLQKADDKYTVKGHNYNTENQMELYRILSGYSYAAPLSFNGKLDLRREFQSYSDPRFANLRPAPKSMENSTLDGKPVHKLTVLSHGDRSTIAFYDPANSGALLRYESSHSYDFDTLKVVPIRTIGTISYVDSPLGYPVPKEHKCWYQKPDGTIIRQFEIEYLEYENYTPKSDDFDLEKHYGIKALPRPEAAGPAPEGKSTFASTGSRWGRYLWYIAGALAVTTVGLFVFVWRKRRKNSGSPKSA